MVEQPKDLGDPMGRFTEKMPFLPTYGGFLGGVAGIISGGLVGIFRQNPGAALFLALIGFFVGSFGGYLLGYAGFMAVSLHRQGRTSQAVLFMALVLVLTVLLAWLLFF
jgi:membrane protein YqaA with SNARE-associated domain